MRLIIFCRLKKCKTIPAKNLKTVKLNCIHCHVPTWQSTYVCCQFSVDMCYVHCWELALCGIHPPPLGRLKVNVLQQHFPLSQQGLSFLFYPYCCTTLNKFTKVGFTCCSRRYPAGCDRYSDLIMLNIYRTVRAVNTVGLVSSAFGRISCQTALT